MNISTIDFNDIVQIIGLITSLITVIVSLYTLSTAFRFRSELALSEQITNVPLLLSQDYVDRKFIPPIYTDDKEINSIRDARLLAQKAIRPSDSKTEKDARLQFLENTMEDGTWENKFAYEVSLGLERVGLMVLSGGLPANYVFEDAALVIIED